jgi:hypothetical protein
MIESAGRTFVAHPVLGRGPGSLVGFWQGPLRAHLTPLDVAATTGLPSLLFLCGYVLMLWRGRRRPTNAALWTGMAALGIDALTQDTEHFRQVWMMFGVADADATTSDASPS